jgi:hypothetical protein
MQRRRLRLSGLTLGCLSSALVILAQLAPTVHALAPHEHPSSSCKHSGTQLHLESTTGADSGPCLVCAHLSGSHVFLFAAPPRIDEIRSIRSSAPSIHFAFDARARELPDSRGPPLLFSFAAPSEVGLTASDW